MTPSSNMLQKQALDSINKQQFGTAKSLLEKLCRQQPKDIQTWLMLGAVYGVLGDYRAAEKCCRKTLRLNPNFSEAHLNLGKTLKAQSKFKEAIASYRKAIRCKPNYLNAYQGLGNAYREAMMHDKAVETFNAALKISPDNSLVLYDLANTYKARGEIVEAVRCFRHVMTLEPNHKLAQMNLTVCMNNYSSCDNESIYKEHCRWGQMLDNGSPDTHCFNDISDPERPLRIGYVSADFRMHSVAFFFEPLLANRNTNLFEVTCYSEVEQADEMTETLRSLSDAWRDTRGLSDSEMYSMIQADSIDILVDLSGLTYGHRLEVFAMKPSPVQVNYLGYAGTTGLPNMDYRIIDNLSDPPGDGDQYHTETLIRLPQSFLCYKPPLASPAVSDLPAQTARHVTFGSFNDLSKITPDVVKVWSEILKQVPDSRLICKARRLKDKSICAMYYELFSSHGISPNRIELLGQVESFSAHLDLYSRIDISLDTFPYNGTTTTCEALWMGVPVVGIKGERHISRVGMSLLINLGLDDLIANDTQGYIAIAVNLANNLEDLSKLRSGLRKRLESSSICDAMNFTRQLECAYRDMWRTYCARGNSQSEQ